MQSAVINERTKSFSHVSAQVILPSCYLFHLSLANDNPQLFKGFTCCTLLIDSESNGLFIPRRPHTLSDCPYLQQHIPTMAGFQDGERANCIPCHVQYPHAEVTTVDGGSSYVRQVMQAGQPVPPKDDTLSFHNRGSRVASKSSTLVHQIRQIYVITRLNDRLPCIRPNGPDIASNFLFRLVALAFCAFGVRNAKSAVHAQRQAGARWTMLSITDWIPVSGPIFLFAVLIRCYSHVQHSKCLLPSTAGPTCTTILSVSTVWFHGRCSRICTPNYDPWEREGWMYLPKLRSTSHSLLQVISIIGCR